MSLAKITPNTIITMMSTAIIEKASESEILSLTPTQIKLLNTEQIKVLNISYLTPMQRGCFSDQQINALTPEQVYTLIEIGETSENNPFGTETNSKALWFKVSNTLFKQYRVEGKYDKKLGALDTNSPASLVAPAPQDQDIDAAIEASVREARRIEEAEAQDAINLSRALEANSSTSFVARPTQDQDINAAIEASVREASLKEARRIEEVEEQEAINLSRVLKESLKFEHEEKQMPREKHKNSYIPKAVTKIKSLNDNSTIETIKAPVVVCDKEEDSITIFFQDAKNNREISSEAGFYVEFFDNEDNMTGIWNKEIGLNGEYPYLD